MVELFKVNCVLIGRVGGYYRTLFCIFYGCFILILVASEPCVSLADLHNRFGTCNDACGRKTLECCRNISASVPESFQICCKTL